MAGARKAKVSVTIAVDLLEQIDAFAERTGLGNRSQVIELWLRRAARQQAADRLAEETAAYYTGRSRLEAEDDAAWAAAAEGELGRLDDD